MIYFVILIANILISSKIGLLGCISKERNLLRREEKLSASGIKTENIGVKENGTIVLNCQDENSNIECEWKLNNIHLLSSSEKIYKIVDIKANENGTYTCSYNGVIKGYFHVNVEYPARISKESIPQVQDLIENYHGTIICPIQANPPITSVLWTINGSRIEPNVDPNYSLHSNGSLLIHNVTKEDHMGAYSCTPINVHGSSSTAILMGAVFDTVFVFHEPRRELTSYVGGEISLLCSGSGMLNTTVEFTKDNELLPKCLSFGEWAKRKEVTGVTKRRCYSMGLLRVSEVSKQDSGIYNCVISNKAGKKILSSNVTVKDLHEDCLEFAFVEGTKIFKLGEFVESASHCRQLCQTEPNCLTFEIGDNYRRCYLYSFIKKKYTISNLDIANDKLVGTRDCN